MPRPKVFLSYITLYMGRYTTVVGDPHDINTWSNIPYFFMKAGQRQGFIEGGLPLKPDRLNVHRLLWNAWALVRYGAYGGFQYSPYFLERLFDQVSVDAAEDEFISHFPLLPPAPASNGYQVSYYIDATLKQNFDDYGVGDHVSTSVQERTLRQEQENYHHADRVVCMSRWAASSVVDDYGVVASNVHVVPGGANLSEELLQSLDTPSFEKKGFSPLRLGFVGKNWERKGLRFLLSVADVLTERGHVVEILAIGPSADELPPHPCVTPIGFVDKKSNLSEFVEIVRGFHFGCLFSSIEAFGISNIECLRLGVPVLAFDVGGIPDTIPEGLGHLFNPDTTPEDVASVLQDYIQNPDSYRTLQQRVWSRAPTFSWDHVVDVFQSMWEGSPDHAYDRI